MSFVIERADRAVGPAVAHACCGSHDGCIEHHAIAREARSDEATRRLISATQLEADRLLRAISDQFARDIDERHDDTIVLTTRIDNARTRRRDRFAERDVTCGAREPLADLLLVRRMYVVTLA